MPYAISHSLFACYCCYYVSCATVVSKLAKIDSLPGAKIKSAIGDGNSKTVADESAFGMSWHIVVAFKSVLIIWLTLFDHAVEDAFHVDANVRICVFIDGQSC